MKTIIGIGNPGKKYSLTRHNAGIMLCEFLKTSDFKVLTSDKFMNTSGEFVHAQVNYFNLDLDNLYIAHDDLDLRLGGYKITKKAPKVHNGINSINEALNSEDYWKIRIGIDNRDPLNRTLGEDYVLDNFESHELKVLETVFEEIKKELNG